MANERLSKEEQDYINRLHSEGLKAEELLKSNVNVNILPRDVRAIDMQMVGRIGRDGWPAKQANINEQYGKMGGCTFDEAVKATTKRLESHLDISRTEDEPVPSQFVDVQVEYEKLRAHAEYLKARLDEVACRTIGDFAIGFIVGIIVAAGSFAIFF